ncbi:hypothetical protein [Sphaerisporangium sp. NPDC051011]|uniref:hypothetical protein n=1 Tax=Sphaerisporangium sp. NPDC051011 TaxID=3155792 RepID=UPI0033DA5715
MSISIVLAVLAIAVNAATLVMMAAWRRRMEPKQRQAEASAASARRDADRAQDILRRMRERVTSGVF